MSSSSLVKNENDLKRIANLVLNKDILSIYTNRKDVGLIIDEKIDAEKKKVGDMIDNV
jgi:hypothetical protein